MQHTQHVNAREKRERRGAKTEKEQRDRARKASLRDMTEMADAIKRVCQSVKASPDWRIQTLIKRPVLPLILCALLLALVGMSVGQPTLARVQYD